MARRLIDTGFWDDQDVAALCAQERLLLLCMITDQALSNDYGVMPANPAALRKHAFGYDDYTLAQVEAWRDNIVRTCKNVVLFEVDGQEYLSLKNFTKYQGNRYHRSTAFPAPPVDGDGSERVPPPPEEDCPPIVEKCETFPQDAPCIVLSCIDSSSIDMSSSVLEEPAPDKADHDDNLLAYFWKKLENVSGLIGSHQAELYQDMVRDIETIPIAQQRPFVDGLFMEAAANTTGRVRPSWYRAVIDSALREGRLPGDKRAGANARAPAPAREPTPDEWAEVARQLGQAVT